MNQAQKLAALQRWADAMQKGDALMDPVISLLALQPEGPITEALWLTQSALTQATACMVDDRAEWLIWFSTDNKFGAAAMDAGPAGALRPIRSLSDLLWVIEAAA